VVAESGADAIVAYEDRQLDGKRFDIALLDMQMPKMDGEMLA
jgi:CheY-like chemotaxis protein